MQTTETKTEQATTAAPAAPAEKPKKKKWIVLGILALVLLGGALFVYDKYIGLPVPFVLSKKPITVTPRLGKKGVGHDVGKTGGTLELAGEKGTYTLNFPAKSLMKGERVTAREISSIKGLKLGWKYVGGVQVEPSGAMIGKPATLTIDTKGATGKLAAFSYDENGQDFHFVPATFKEGIATIPVYHFSGFGVLDMGSSKPVSGTPSGMHARYEAAKHGVEADAAANNGGGINENDPYAKRLYNLLHAWYAATVKPRLTASISSGDDADGAVLEFEQWRAHNQETPGGTENLATETNEGMNLSAQAIKAGVDKAHTRCVQNKDATQAGVMIRLMALAQTDDFIGRVPGLTDEAIKQKVASCATFKLTVKSTITDNIDGHIYSDSAEGSGVLTTDSDLKLSGEGKITVTDMTVADMTCTWNEMDNFKVKDVSLIFEGNKKADLTIQVWPDDGDTYRCEDNSPDYTFTSTGENTGPWWGAYANAHDDELPSFASDMFTMKDWQIVNSGGVYAKKVYNRTRYPSKVPAVFMWILRLIGGDRPLTDNTTWELLHTPR